LATIPENELIFCSDPWSPYAGQEDAEKEGYIVDVLRAIFEPKGYTVEFVNLPWTRCIKDTRDGRISGMAGADVLEVPDFIFPTATVGVTTPRFFVNAGSPWRFVNVQSLTSVVMGVIQDYTYADSIDRYIQRSQGSERLHMVKGNDPLGRLIEALHNRRIDTFVENAAVAHHALAAAGLDGQIVEAGGPDAGVRLFVPFSPKLPKATEYARMFDEGIAELRSSGRLGEILAEYNLTEWIHEADRLRKNGSSAHE